MNDVNLNSPDLKLVRSGEKAPARASASPRAEGTDASALAASSESGASASIQTIYSNAETRASSAAERLEKRSEVQREQLDDAVSKLNDYVQNVQRDLQFEVNNELGETIVRVVDQETQEVIRQIPDEVAMRLAENLQQDEPLTLFNVKV
ncbi:flagellar protein FlaG [Marinobacter sp. NP-4(2019)]|uniref:flagellar protein FlaG n=1 Tax=Marinobacter sp. NP-4(2019) TaxID=2488665 RepID=UPI000FC3D233|nr:flagellar protein FlaG [Marinobacter sp. NP-4(2019)]AZT84480.1 flagellar protein FlaG [Marinobacter sp. NP-4(2019)]